MDPNELNPDLFEPYDRLIEIEILGTKRLVPDNNTLLRCFQYVSPESASSGELCWNGECLNCMVRIRNGDRERSVIACLFKPEAGTQIIEVSPETGFPSGSESM